MSTPSNGWNFVTRIGFRFGVGYFVLYILEVSGGWRLRPVRASVGWIARHLFGARIVGFRWDSVFGWVALACLLVTAAAAALVWSVLDRRRLAYPLAHQWFRLLLRGYLAVQLVWAGMDKVFQLQMPFLYSRLVEPFGDFSPQGVLWSSVAASHPYEILLGCAEVTAAVLLVLPRTTAAGALLAAVDMALVFVDNMTFDVGVKTFALHLLLMSLVLLAPDLRRLAVVFFSDRVPGPPGRRALLGQVAAGLVLLAGVGSFDYAHASRPAPPLHGIWNVENFTADGVEHPPLLTDDMRWRRLVFDAPYGIADPVEIMVQHMDDGFDEFGGVVDVHRGLVVFTHSIAWGTYQAIPTQVVFAYHVPAIDLLVLSGDFGGHQLNIQLRRVDVNSFTLVNRGFHWVQETPFNR